MSYVVDIHRDARRDLEAIRDYYRVEAPEQLRRFDHDVIATARRLSEFPRSAPEIHASLRRANLHTFPYQLWYQVHDDAELVVIVAVMHHRRR